MPKPYSVEHMQPSFPEVLEQVKSLKLAGDKDGSVEAVVHYINSRGLQRLRINLGVHALIANRDLSFETIPEDNKNKRYGILAMEGTAIQMTL